MSKKNANRSKVSSSKTTEQKLAQKKKFQTIIGITLLVVGTFLTVSIISYLFTWKKDQSNLLSHESLGDFLLFNREHIYNWCGRVGAAASHFIVYNTIGISGILFTIWSIFLGLKALNPHAYFGLRIWRKWLLFSLLFIAPVLSLVLPNSSINWGGSLGIQTTTWINGFAGKIGNIFLFLTMGVVFLIYVFKVNIKRLWQWIPTSNLSKESTKETFKGYRNPTPNPIDKNESIILQESAHKDHKILLNLEEEEHKELIKKKAESTVESVQQTTTIHDLYLTNEEKDSESLPTSLEEIPTDHSERIILELPEEAHIPEQEELEEWEDEAPEVETSFEISTNEEDIIPAVKGNSSVEGQEPYDPSLELSRFKFPTLDLLEEYEGDGKLHFNKEELENNKDQIIKTLQNFGIEIQKIKATVGPTVTLYEIIPSAGVRISKIKNLEDDIALSLAALGIRIIAPIPGRGTIGIEVPNSDKQLVGMRSLLSSEKFVNNKMSLPIALGKKIDNEHFIVDLATMPHLLMAGATGQGKSVGINAILISLLYKKHPSQLKFVMVDPKKVELSIYRLIEKHYLAKLPDEEEAIITDVTKVVNTLNALGIEMDNRYELLKDARARNIKEYNEKFVQRRLNPNDGHKYLPFIVLVIDEFADLIMVAGKEVEMPIARLAQLARAVGIHIIIATQRPSVNVITGIIKANFPGRIAFKVSAKVDSRTILDAGGAEQLIGKGDMLFSQGSEIIRLQCAFVDTPEVERVVEFIGKQQGYPTAFELPEFEGEEIENGKGGVDLSDRDKLFADCAQLIVSAQSGSTSMLQRRFNLGYNRAGRIMDQLEAAGIVGPQVGSKPREVYVHTEQELNQLLINLP